MGVVKTVRLFIALPMSGEIRNRCGALQNIGREKIASVRWVDPEQIHLTLVFLGWTDPALLARIEEMIRKAALAFSPFSIRVAGLGVFPRLQSPKVIWAGVSQEESLMKLQHQLAVRMASLGFEKETRPYRPHLTLGRVKQGLAPDPFTHWIIEEKEQDIGRCEIKEVMLIQSQPRPEGSVYTCLFTSTLGGSKGTNESAVDL